MFSRIKFLFLFLSMPIAAMELPYNYGTTKADADNSGVPTLKKQSLNALVKSKETQQELKQVADKLPQDLKEHFAHLVKKSNQSQEFTDVVELGSIELSPDQMEVFTHGHYSLSPQEKYVAGSFSDKNSFSDKGCVVNLKNGKAQNFKQNFRTWNTTDHTFFTKLNNSAFIHASNSGKKVASLHPNLKPDPITLKKYTLNGKPIEIRIDVEHGLHVIAPHFKYTFQSISPSGRYLCPSRYLLDLQDNRIIFLTTDNMVPINDFTFIDDQIAVATWQTHFCSYLGLFNVHDGSLIKKVELAGTIHALEYIAGNICITRNPNIIELYDEQLELKKQIKLDGCCGMQSAFILKTLKQIAVIDQNKLIMYQLITPFDTHIAQFDKTNSSLSLIQKASRDIYTAARNKHVMGPAIGLAIMVAANSGKFNLSEGSSMYMAYMTFIKQPGNLFYLTLHLLTISAISLMLSFLDQYSNADVSEMIPVANELMTLSALATVLYAYRND